jgi:hypothetical protein
MVGYSFFLVCFRIMIRQRKINWSGITNIMGNIVVPLVAVVSLIVAYVAMRYSHESVEYGASLEKQQHEIDTLGVVIKQLAVLDYTQHFTNISLQKNLDSQSREIAELNKLHSIASEQFQISKTSLGLVIDDKAMSISLDRKAFTLGLDKLILSLNDLFVYINPPHDPSEPFGEDFDAKIGAAKNQLLNLTTNRYAWSRQYEYNDLLTLINFMNLTHLQFQRWHYSYPPVDFTIENRFLELFYYQIYLYKNDSVSCRLFTIGMDSINRVIAHDADSVFKAGHYVQ